MDHPDWDSVMQYVSEPLDLDLERRYEQSNGQIPTPPVSVLSLQDGFLLSDLVRSWSSALARRVTCPRGPFSRRDSRLCFNHVLSGRTTPLHYPGYHSTLFRQRIFLRPFQPFVRVLRQWFPFVPVSIFTIAERPRSRHQRPGHFGHT